MASPLPGAGIDSATGRAVVASSQGLSLRVNFSWTLAGNVVYAGCQWGMLVVLAHLGSPETVGRFALGLAVTAPVVLMANLQLRAVQATDAARHYRFGDYLALRTVTTLLALLVISAIAVLGGYRPATALVIVALGCAKAFEAMSDIYYGLLQQHERMDRLAISLMVRGALALAVLGATVYVTGSVFWGAAAMAGAWALVFAFYDVQSGRRMLRDAAVNGEQVETASRPIWRPDVLYPLALLALPLGFAMMLISLNVNIPRYFIARYSGEHNLGIFAAMTYMMMAGTTVVSALAQSAVPRLARLYAAGDAAGYSQLLKRLVAFGAAVGAAGVVVVVLRGKWLLGALYGAEYARQSNVFVWVAVASVASLIQWFLSHGMTAARSFRIQAPLYASVTAVTLLGSLWLIPARGLIGAAMVLVFAECFLAVATLAADIRAIRKIRPS